MAERAGVAFEVERLEPAGEDRLELTGRWSGVRGLRFVRPSLTVRTDDGERRLLALLDHKPWVAGEDGSWVVAFPWDGGPIDPAQAELAVAPNVVVSLGGKPEPGAKAEQSREAAREQAERERVSRLEREVAWLREEREALIAVRERAREELDAFAGERDAAKAESDRLRAESEQVRAERDEISGNVERDRERAAREYSAVVAERDRAMRERDAAVHDRDQALRERDDAIVARQAASAERDAALGRETGVPTLPVVGGPTQPVRLGALLWGYRRRPATREWPARALAFGAIIAVLAVLLLLFL